VEKVQSALLLLAISTRTTTADPSAAGIDSPQSTKSRQLLFTLLHVYAAATLEFSQEHGLVVHLVGVSIVF
jgi:hypothetical protein